MALPPRQGSELAVAERGWSGRQGERGGEERTREKRNWPAPVVEPSPICVCGVIRSTYMGGAVLFDLPRLQ